MDPQTVTAAEVVEMTPALTLRDVARAVGVDRVDLDHELTRIEAMRLAYIVGRKRLRPFRRAFAGIATTADRRALSKAGLANAGWAS